MNPYERAHAPESRHLLGLSGRRESGSEHEGMVDRLRHCREELSAARVELADAITASNWASQRYENAATKARSAASAWFRTRGRWQATNNALRRQFIDAVVCAERLRHERMEVATVASMLRTEIELIEREIVGLTQQIGLLADLDVSNGSPA